MKCFLKVTTIDSICDFIWSCPEHIGVVVGGGRFIRSKPRVSDMSRKGKEKIPIDNLELSPVEFQWIMAGEYAKDFPSVKEIIAMEDFMLTMDKLRADKKRYKAFKNSQTLKRMNNMRKNAPLYEQSQK